MGSLNRMSEGDNRSMGDIYVNMEFPICYCRDDRIKLSSPFAYEQVIKGT